MWKPRYLVVNTADSYCKDSCTEGNGMPLWFRSEEPVSDGCQTKAFCKFLPVIIVLYLGKESDTDLDVRTDHHSQAFWQLSPCLHETGWRWTICHGCWLRSSLGTMLCHAFSTHAYWFCRSSYLGFDMAVKVWSSCLPCCRSLQCSPFCHPQISPLFGYTLMYVCIAASCAVPSTCLLSLEKNTRA